MVQTRGISNQSLLLIGRAAICLTIWLTGMELFFKVWTKNFFVGYTQWNVLAMPISTNYSGVQPIKNIFSKFVKCYRWWQYFFFVLFGRPRNISFSFLFSFKFYIDFLILILFLLFYFSLNIF